METPTADEVFEEIANALVVNDKPSQTPCPECGIYAYHPRLMAGPMCSNCGHEDPTNLPMQLLGMIGKDVDWQHLYEKAK